MNTNVIVCTICFSTVGIVLMIVCLNRKWLDSKRKLTRDEIETINKRLNILEWNVRTHNHNLGLINYYVMRSAKYIRWLSYGIPRRVDVALDLEDEDPTFRKYEKEKQREYTYEDVPDEAIYEEVAPGKFVLKEQKTRKRKVN